MLARISGGFPFARGTTPKSTGTSETVASVGSRAKSSGRDGRSGTGGPDPKTL